MTTVNEFLEVLEEAEDELRELGFNKVGIEIPHAVYATYRFGLYRLQLMYGPSEFHAEFALFYNNREVMKETLFELPEVEKYIEDIPKPLVQTQTSLKDEVFFVVNLIKAARPYLIRANLKTRERPANRK